MKRIFISHVVPPKLIRRYNQSQAGNNFAYNLIDGGCFDEVYSILPSNIYNHIDELNEEKVRFIVLRSLRKGKWLTTISVFIENVLLQLKLQKPANVWFYNITLLNFLSFIIIRFLRRNFKAYVIVLDYTPGNTIISSQTFYLWLLNKADGVISLSDTESFRRKNTLCLAGVVPVIEITHPKIVKPSNVFLLSGVINERIAMISIILEVFSSLPNCSLYITGYVADNSLLKKHASQFPNIHFCGNLSYNEYTELLHNTTFCLSTRNPDCVENRYNFPSKIIEHLWHNRIVISTMEYNQIADLKYFLIPINLEEMRDAIGRIISLDDEFLLQYSNQGAKVQSMFSVNVWNATFKMIEEACNGPIIHQTRL